MSTPHGERRVVIVGGGITGLATAHALVQGARATKRPLTLTVLEASSRLGGNITTERTDDFTLDGGPDSWVSSKPQATALARGVGLGDDLVGTIEANRRVYVAWEGGLHALPEGLVLAVPTKAMPVLRSQLFSWQAKLRMGLEPMIPARALAEDEDESIASFVSRRLGREVTDRLAAPMLGGIFAGDANELSIRATFPQFLEMEKTHGSLIRAMRAAKRAQQKQSNGGAAPSAFTSVKRGLGSLVDALATSLEGTATVRMNARVKTIASLPANDARGRYAVELESGESLLADDVVLASPAHASSRMLANLDARVARELEAIQYVSTATVFLAFARADVAHPLDATGFIVPRSLGRPLLAATWVSSKWEGRAPSGKVLMRVFFGGAHGQSLLDKDDSALVQLARAELEGLMDLHATPLFTRVFRFDRASAQPLVGHLGRMARIRAGLERCPGVYVAGGGLDGIGIPDCIRQGGDVAKKILAE